MITALFAVCGLLLWAMYLKARLYEARNLAQSWEYAYRAEVQDHANATAYKSTGTR